MDNTKEWQSQMNYLALNLHDISQAAGKFCTMDLFVNEVRTIFPTDELTKLNDQDIYSLINDYNTYMYWIKQ